jgi:hypothetical protein
MIVLLVDDLVPAETIHPASGAGYATNRQLTKNAQNTSEAAALTKR